MPKNTDKHANFLQPAAATCHKLKSIRNVYKNKIKRQIADAAVTSKEANFTIHIQAYLYYQC